MSRRSLCAAAAAWFLVVSVVAAQSTPGGAYKGLFFLNDFSYLNDPAYNDWHLGETAKGIGVTESLTADFGGQYRMRFHNESNLRGRALSGVNDDFLLQRSRVFGRLKYQDLFSIYIEGLDAMEDGNRQRPRGIEVNRFDMQNLFGQLKLLETPAGSLSVRGGRQEMLFGGQRLVSPLDWANTRRTFDGVTGLWQSETVDFAGFWSRPVLPGQHLSPTPDGAPFDTNFDAPNQDREFFGGYGTLRALDAAPIDLYYLRYANYGASPFQNHTFGARVNYAQDGYLWELEGAYQFGEVGMMNQSAAFVTCGAGRALSDLPWTPTVWAYYDWASGGTRGNDVYTFNQLFPLGHKYLGFMDVVARQNIHDLNFLLTAKPCEKVTLLAWFHNFWLAGANDALYNAPGAPIYQDTTGGAGRYIGHELDFTVAWSLTERMNLLFGYSHFFTGDYFDDPAAIQRSAGDSLHNGKDADFFYTQYLINF